MPLQLNSKDARLDNVNLRSEGSEGSRKTAVDLKFSGIINKSNLKALLNIPEVPDFWDEEKKNEFRFPGIGLITCLAKFEEAKVTFGDNFEITGCKVNNFSLELKDGGVMFVTLRVQCNPNKQQLGAISELQHERAKLMIKANLLIDPDPEENAGGEEESQEDLLGGDPDANQKK